MSRHHEREKRIGIAGLLAGAFLTFGVHDMVMSRSAEASDLDLGGRLHHAVADALGLPTLKDHGAAGTVMRVFDDMIDVVFGEREDEEKE